MPDPTPLKGEDMENVIYKYTRQDALEDGFLIDVTETAKEAGIKYPVALTHAVYEDCVEWSDSDSNRKKTYQDKAGRLWDVVSMLRFAIANCKGDTVFYRLYRVPRSGRGKLPRQVTLKAVVNGGDDGQPVITIMQQNED